MHPSEKHPRIESLKSLLAQANALLDQSVAAGEAAAVVQVQIILIELLGLLLAEEEPG